jgi:cupin superfamily acireductone dioxygenase involved in methionine salvage
MSRFKFRDVVGTETPARKTLIATFAGEHFVAERDGGELRIYVIGNGEFGGVEVGDRARAADQNLSDAERIKAQQRLNDEFYRKPAA